MANIFKKIIGIEEIDEPTSNDLSSENISKLEKSDSPLGLKPVMQQDSKDNITAADFDDPFGKEINDDLNIPSLMPISKPVSKIQADDIPNKDETDVLGKRVKELNLRPIEDPLNDAPQKELSSTSITQLIKSIDEISEEEHVRGKTPDHVQSDTNTNISKPSNIDNIGHDKPFNTPLPLPQTQESFPAFMSADTQIALDMPEFRASKWPFWGLIFLALFWILSSAAVAYGYFELGLTALTANPIHAFSFAGFVFVPACLLLITALMTRRLNRLSVESQKMAFLNQQLLTPSKTSATSAMRLTDAITAQMDRIEQRADQAFSRLQTVQTAFTNQIEDVSKTLSISADRQIGLDTHLKDSKSEWASAIRHTDQSITDLSATLDNVLASFQTRMQTTQDQMSQIGDILKQNSQDSNLAITPLLEKSNELQTTLVTQMESINQLRDDMANSVEELDQLTKAQAEKLTNLRAHQTIFKTETSDLHTMWVQGDRQAQENIFAKFSQIDVLNERVDALLAKIERAADNFQEPEDDALTPPSNDDFASAMTSPLRGSMDDPQLSFLPGLGDAKDMLPSLLSNEEPVEQGIDDTLTLTYENIKDSDLHEPLYTPPQLNEAPQSTLSSQRVIDTTPTKKASWFKRFGRRSDTQPRVNMKSPIPAADIAAQPIKPPQQPLHPAPVSQAYQTQPHAVSHSPMTLRERLIREQLSPDALIDAGCVQRAVYIRIQDGPFAMSRFIATHLGAAAEHLKQLLPHDPELRMLVHDKAAAYPIREQLDRRGEEALNLILSSESGREYLLCDAALNG